MQTIPREQVRKRLDAENPWWQSPHGLGEPYAKWRPRAYLDLFAPLVEDTHVNRAVLLMGPRRVGKTVLLHHTIAKLIQNGVDPRNICYISIDNPIYTGCSLEQLLEDYVSASGGSESETRRYVFFDEIQYLRDWEIHLKTLVDKRSPFKFVASGSAAAALRLRSQESGAGRFTDFLLPPLTFHEYLELLDTQEIVGPIDDDPAPGRGFHTTSDIAGLNEHFLRYLNFGGYPEVVLSPTIQADPGRYIKADIVDKVLLRDLPSLYGIQDIQELNYLFTTLAYNTAQEVSLEQLSQSSGVAKNTIKRYIEYLEAAFLIRIVHRIDRSGRRFQRANFFKVYLTNPSIRAALFSPLGPDDEAVGALAETGILSQWFHADTPRYYARWDRGEVDIVGLNDAQKPSWAAEVKWSDRFVDRPTELTSLLSFCKQNTMKQAIVTTRTVKQNRDVQGITIRFVPASLYCYTIGRHLVRGKQRTGN